MTFQGGYSEFQNEDGLLIIDPQHFILKNSIIRNCHVNWGDGTAIWVQSVGVSLLIENTQILNSTYREGTHGTVNIWANEFADVDVKNSSFINNDAWTGSGLRIMGGDVNIDSCKFIDNFSNVSESGTIWLTRIFNSPCLTEKVVSNSFLWKYRCYYN